MVGRKDAPFDRDISDRTAEEVLEPDRHVNRLPKRDFIDVRRDGHLEFGRAIGGDRERVAEGPVVERNLDPIAAEGGILGEIDLAGERPEGIDLEGALVDQVPRGVSDGDIDGRD